MNATADQIARIASTDHPGIVYATELRQVARHFGIKYATKVETFDKVKAAIASSAENASLTTNSTPSPTAQLLAAAHAAREHWVKEAYRLEGTPGEAAADAAEKAAEKACEAAAEAHRAARRAHGDNV